MKAVHRVLLLAIIGAAAVGAARITHAATLNEGAYTFGGFPVGDWSKVAGAGMGVQGVSIVYPNPTRGIGFRSGSRLMYNFMRQADVPSANLDAITTLHTETTNTNFWVGIGPEFGKITGETRPFIYGTIGFDVNWMNSHLKGNVGTAGYDANVGNVGTAFAWTAGMGIRKLMPSVPGGRVELSVEYSSATNHSYVIPDEVKSVGGFVFWDRKSHDTNQVIVRLGTVIGQ